MSEAGAPLQRLCPRNASGSKNGTSLWHKTPLGPETSATAAFHGPVVIQDQNVSAPLIWGFFSYIFLFFFFLQRLNSRFKKIKSLL